MLPRCGLRLVLLMLVPLLAASCGGRESVRDAMAESPTAPGAVVAKPPAGSPSSPGSPAASGDQERVAQPVALPRDEVRGTSSVDFPPRDQSFDFRRFLEEFYRTELGRSAGSTYVDVEGDLVWTQEYLRYRVNLCGHLDAVQKVFDQIDRGTIAPVCGDAPPGTVAFPPRDEAFDFRQRLEAKYRDGLRRSPSSSYVDVEGSIVWTQEYLRYRVNRCDHWTSQSNVIAEIRGGSVPPVCGSSNVTGDWTGVIDMGDSPRPFTMSISQVGADVRGTYQDIAWGTVSGTYSGGDRFDFFVNFGDGSGTFNGEFDGPNRVRGTMKYDKIARRLDFEMVRTVPRTR